MFTGLIETTGRVRSLSRTGDGARVVVETSLAGELGRGESVAVNGVCLTVVETGAATFGADAVAETLRATTLGALIPGDRVNLERAIRVGDRLGGHIVTGHVDGVGTVIERLDRRSGAEMSLRVPPELMPEIVAKGSIAIDGTSLTVAAVSADAVTIALIPETLSATVSSAYHSGSRVNVETDVLAKHLRRLTTTGASGGEDAANGAPEEKGLTFARLRELGF